LARAKRALSSKSFPSDVLQMIEEDIIRTLPTLQIFHPEHGPLYQDLKDILCAWVVARSDEGLGYVRLPPSVLSNILIH
jgi:TBC1 domain family member 14